MNMFSAKDVEVGQGISKYQQAGVSEKVTITEINLIKNEQWNTQSIEFKTINENNQEGKSKRLSLNTTVREGNKTSAWNVTVGNLVNIITSATGKSIEEAKAVLEAPNAEELVAKLSTELVGKPFRGLFGQREYAQDKFAVELYSTEPVGGTKLKYDPANGYYNKRLTAVAKPVTASDDLPF